MKDASLGSWANGYDDERAVFDAVAADPSLAIVDPSVLPDGFNDYEFYADDVTVENDRFEPFQLQFIDTVTGNEKTVTVIGVLASRSARSTRPASTSTTRLTGRSSASPITCAATSS